MRLIQNKKVPEILNPEVESDDEAPEEVTQSSSRQKAAAVKKNIQESERLKKKRTKEKKREQNELFLKQKEEKLAELSKRKLPQDVLDAVSTSSKKKVKQNDDDDDQSEDESDIENDSDEENSKLSDSEILGGDFIPFNNVEKKEKQKSKKNKTGGVEVVSTTHLQSQLLTSAEKAKKFREEKLYNQNINPRQAYKQKQRLLHKRMFLKR